MGSAPDATSLGSEVGGVMVLGSPFFRAKPVADSAGTPALHGMPGHTMYSLKPGGFRRCGRDALGMGMRTGLVGIRSGPR
jgi:hypothetical protein